MPYIDAFLLPVPKKNVDAYRRIAKKASKVWLDHGALEYRECVGDDLNFAGDMGVSFLSLNNFKKNETAMFSWIVYKSRAHRDAVNKKVMKDPRMHKMMDETKPVFDYKRMAFGGFKIIVDAMAKKK